MQTIQIGLDEKLLIAVEVAAKRRKVSRSAFIREVLREHLNQLRLRELEEQDRLGYLTQPQRAGEFKVWEDAAAWPDV